MNTRRRTLWTKSSCSSHKPISWELSGRSSLPRLLGRPWSQGDVPSARGLDGQAAAGRWRRVTFLLGSFCFLRASGWRRGVWFEPGLTLISLIWNLALFCHFLQTSLEMFIRWQSWKRAKAVLLIPLVSGWIWKGCFQTRSRLHLSELHSSWPPGFQRERGKTHQHSQPPWMWLREGWEEDSGAHWATGSGPFTRMCPSSGQSQV